MGTLFEHHWPRGTHQRPWGKRSKCVGMMGKRYFLLLVGFLFVGFLFQPIKSEAAALCPTSYDDGIPENIREYCELVGFEYDICPEILESIGYHETRFGPTLKNKNCWGIMQVNIKVHKERIEKFGWTEEDMLDPYKNITVAADFLAELYETYGDDNPIVLCVYSGNWKAIPKYKEYGFIPDYVNDILTRSEEYERLHGK